MLTRIGNKVTVGRPLCNVLRIGRPLEGGGSFLRDWTVYGKSEVVGSSVLGVGDVYPWNQQVVNGNFANGTANWGVRPGYSFEVADGVAHSFGGSANFIRQNFPVVSGHKYLLCYQAKWYNDGATSDERLVYSMDYSTATGYSGGNYIAEGVWVSAFSVTSPTADGISICGAAGILNLYVKNVMVIDLTAIFGAGNEPSTVDEFKAWLVKVGKMAKVTDDIPYFPYDAGSTFTSLPIVASSRNLWDEECELGSISIATGALVPSTTSIRSKNFCEITGNTVALCNASGIYSNNRIIMVLYDKDKQLVDFWAFNATFPVRIVNIVSGAKYFKLSFDTAYGSTYNHDICINISDALNGTYTPHQSQRFPLVISSPLHGIGDVRDIMRYSDHGITRKYGSIDFGSLAISTYDASAGVFIATFAASMGRDRTRILCAKYTTSNVYFGTMPDKSIGGVGGVSSIFFIKDSDFIGKTNAEVKAALTGIPLYFELATPTFELVTLPKLPAYRDGTVLYTDTQVHGDTIAGEAPVGFSLLPPVTMTPPTGNADTNGQTDDTATE